MPFKASQGVILQNLYLPGVAVDTGYIAAGSYWRCTITNRGNDMLHVLEKSVFCCFAVQSGQKWSVEQEKGGLEKPLQCLG